MVELLRYRFDHFEDRHDFEAFPDLEVVHIHKFGKREIP
jgi:hypothetical protein